ncbi:hypothetical protein DXA13_02095 [Clostridium sp. AM58-1XD]|nr:hypothetical protein DXA13_02095 [Clostridium sp. AM58-1XD]
MLSCRKAPLLCLQLYLPYGILPFIICLRFTLLLRLSFVNISNCKTRLTGFLIFSILFSCKIVFIWIHFVYFFMDSPKFINDFFIDMK